MPSRLRPIARPEAESFARAASLRYVHDDERGLRRRRRKGVFVYVDDEGRRAREPATIARIRSLAIPPAWTEVWICLSPDGHIQATGRDARGRKQYRYHPQWRVVRDEAKFEELTSFGWVLPGLRARIARDLARPTLDRDKVVATILALMEQTSVRVGNDCYATQNRSFGLTTLRDRHAQVGRTCVTFAFTGKSGKVHRISVRDRRLAAIVRRCRDLPGQRLFQFVDAEGVQHPVTSTDVNNYLQEATAAPFTAKMIRTWIGTVTAARALHELPPCESERAGKRSVLACLELVSEKLGNTPSIARKSYVHPRLFESYLDGSFHDAMKLALRRTSRRALDGLDLHERALLIFLAPTSTATLRRESGTTRVAA
ncbi:MAG: DNA topoisomerase IB [Deltaproteobacteria bacterium]|nr:DNA topoisomerase IB [Deltaproteobacteria bacterium]